MVDREARDERPEEPRQRVAERQPAEIHRTVPGRTELAGGVLRGDLEQHEGEADQQRGREQRGQPRQQRRKPRAARASEAPPQHRPAHADAIRQLADGNAEAHWEEREQRHQQADERRRCPLPQRIERYGDATAGQHDVIGDAERDQRCERSRRRRKRQLHGARRSIRQCAPSRR
jgi:hypothetical protein